MTDYSLETILTNNNLIKKNNEEIYTFFGDGSSCSCRIM